MSARGDLPRRPVAQVPAGSDRLWRVGVLAGYDGSAWYPGGTGPSVPTGLDPLGLADGDPSSDLPRRDGRRGAGRVRHPPARTGRGDRGAARLDALSGRLLAEASRPPS